MDVNESPNIKDIILKQYELTDTYHDQKTHSAWIASTVYFVFSIGFYSFWKQIDHTAICILATVLCFVIFSGAMSFISLQFKHRWDSVIRTKMYHWLFDERWTEIKSPEDYRKQKECFAEREKKLNTLGIAKQRKVFEILWMTVLLPIILPASILFSMRAKKKLDVIEKQIQTIEKKKGQEESHMTYREKRPYRQRRRRIYGLIDTRYRTEIPAYTISLYFFISQILLIWFPGVFSLTNFLNQ